MNAKPRIDEVAIVYISVTVLWTLVLICGVAFIWWNRYLPFLQIRRLPLVFGSVACLHLYWVMCMLGYTVYPLLPCTAEYFIMSIYVPFGFAFFQAANSQFLHVADLQRTYTKVKKADASVIHDNLKVYTMQHKKLTWRQQLQRLDKVTKMVIYIAVAMAIELLLTLVIFLASRKFHSGFGLIPVKFASSVKEQRLQCSRGWEWWLSCVWQLFWSWIYAPYLLWKSRKISDTHGWRTQTIACCISGLPATPLWLIAIYAPAFEDVNRRFIPPMWFAISIFFIEVFTIFIPCRQILQRRNLTQQTLSAIAAWEAEVRDDGSIDSNSTKVNSLPSKASSRQFASTTSFRVAREGHTVPNRKSNLLTMAALERALECNASPLQEFAALKDFSGENISFLTMTANWKHRWHLCHKPRVLRLEKQKLNVDDPERREYFNEAIHIYASFISPQFADFPINISSKERRSLQQNFEAPTSVLLGHSSPNRSNIFDKSVAAPFTSHDPSPIIQSAAAEMPLSTNPSIIPTTTTQISTNPSSNIYWYGDIPPTFDDTVFDASIREIKYLVLTNTWPKFVNAGYSETMDRDRGGEGGGSIGMRVSRYLKGLEGKMGY